MNKFNVIFKKNNVNLSGLNLADNLNLFAGWRFLTAYINTGYDSTIIMPLKDYWADGHYLYVSAKIKEYMGLLVSKNRESNVVFVSIYKIYNKKKVFEYINDFSKINNDSLAKSINTALVRLGFDLLSVESAVEIAVKNLLGSNYK